MFWNKAEISVASAGRRCSGRFAQPTSGHYMAFRIRDFPELKGSFKQSGPGWQSTRLSSLLVHFSSVSGHSPVAFLSSPFQRVQAGICQTKDLNFNSFIMSLRKGRVCDLAKQRGEAQSSSSLSFSFNPLLAYKPGSSLGSTCEPAWCYGVAFSTEERFVPYLKNKMRLSRKTALHGDRE